MDKKPTRKSKKSPKLTNGEKVDRRSQKMREKLRENLYLAYVDRHCAAPTKVKISKEHNPQVLILVIVGCMRRMEEAFNQLDRLKELNLLGDAIQEFGEILERIGDKMELLRDS